MDLTLSKKYYENFAVELGHAKSKGDAINRMIAFMERENPRFDKNRFREAVLEAYLSGKDLDAATIGKGTFKTNPKVVYVGSRRFAI